MNFLLPSFPCIPYSCNQDDVLLLVGSYFDFGENSLLLVSSYFDFGENSLLTYMNY